MTVIRFCVAMVVALLLPAYAASSSPLGQHVTLVDNPALPKQGPIQLLGFAGGPLSSAPDDMACIVYLGTDLITSDDKTVVGLTDQAFEEVIGPMCHGRMFKSVKDGKWYNYPRFFVCVGDIILMIKGESDLGDGTLSGNGGCEGPRLTVEYHLKNATGYPSQPKSVPEIEYERVSQQNIPVAASAREPRLGGESKTLVPGQTITLENMTEHTYLGHPKPTLQIFYRTQLSFDDQAAHKSLAKQVVASLAAGRLNEGALNGVMVAAFNEPKRSRFHFRPSFRYDADGGGNERVGR